MLSCSSAVSVFIMGIAMSRIEKITTMEYPRISLALILLIKPRC
jgi:hypothetical protein